MTKCTICNKNTAVVFTTRFENGKRFNEGLCLKCAYKTGLGAMDDIFQKAGINEDNIDDITEKINGVMENTNMQSPEGLLKMIVDGSMGEDSGFSDSFENDNAENYNQRESNELLPVAMAYPSEDSASQPENESGNRNRTGQHERQRQRPGAQGQEAQVSRPVRHQSQL